MLSNAKPLVVHGLRFANGERVKVTFRAGGLTLARTVRATMTGSFALMAPDLLAYDPCSTRSSSWPEVRPETSSS